jgi:hypothetical protein
MAAAAILSQLFLGSYGRREVAMAGVRVIGLLYGRRFTSDNSRPISGPLTLENLAAEV